MSTEKAVSRYIKVMRWIARLWSLLALAVALLVIFMPDPYATGEPVPLRDWFLLSLWGVAILGLLLAWRWERAGSLITITALITRELTWIILKGAWHVNFLLVWAFLVPPAVLYLLAWRWES